MKNINYFHQYLSKGLAIAIIISTTGIFFNTISAQNQANYIAPTDHVRNNHMDFGCDLPPGWNNPIPTPNALIMPIDGTAQILVNGQQMNPWDVVGAFYRDDEGVYKCGGFGCLSESGGFGFVLFGDDQFTPEKDGFDTGDLMVFKVYSWICGKTFVVDSIAFDDLPPEPKILFPPPMGSMITYVSCTTNEECQITAGDEVISDKVFFKVGQWNKLSSIKSKLSANEFLALFGKKLIAVRESVTNKMIWPDMEIYTLPGFEPGKEYHIKVSEDCGVE